MISLVINRELFFLPEKVSLEEYKRRITTKEVYEQKDRSSATITFQLGFNWNMLENYDGLTWSALLKTVFNDNLISYQSLGFSNGNTPRTLFRLIERSYDWGLPEKSNDKWIMKATDNKYTLMLNDYSLELNWTLDPYNLMLFYK